MKFLVNDQPVFTRLAYPTRVRTSFFKLLESKMEPSGVLISQVAAAFSAILRGYFVDEKHILVVIGLVSAACVILRVIFVEGCETLKTVIASVFDFLIFVKHKWHEFQQVDKSSP
jgi:hypothetical protein